MNFNRAQEGHDSIAAPVALLGMACRFPGGSTSPKAFWQQLLRGQSAIGEIPKDRFSIAAHVDANAEAPGKSYTRWGGFVDDIAGFDPAMFEISPREAQAMDPQQRLLLMVAYEAMEDAGLTRSLLGSVRTGVYVGASSSDYAALQRLQRTYSDVYAGTGSALSIVANRISHRFNLNGPSLSIDTACSSSLVALDQAVAALNNDAIDIAIVAGVNLLIDPATFVAFSKAGMLSPTGKLSAFDRKANGYVRGEGIGAVLLMREADAVAQTRRTRALIRATAVNQDGRTSTLTAPDQHAQQEMMKLLCKVADVAPQAIDYVEAHGTGTPIGDPIEAAAIGHVFGGAFRAAPLLFGSVKPNIGHLESAAGIASLIKAVMALENRIAPASVNFDEPNPAIAFEAHNMAVPQVPTELGRDDRSLFIAVNSFGFGGTNAGVLLERAAPKSMPLERPAVSGGTQQNERAVAVPLSATTPEALQEVAVRLRAELVEGGLADRELASVASSVGTLREGLQSRTAIIAATTEELVARLADVAEGSISASVRGALPKIVSGTPSPRSKLAFTFAGQGGQWWGMGRRLLLEEPVFSRAFQEFDRGFEALSGWSVKSELLRDEATSRMGQSRFAMPAIFGVQIGLGALWQSYDVQPDFVLGHSFGELAAAYLAGAISLETATRMIHARCQIREKLGVDGAMLAVGLGAADVAAVLGPDTNIDIAAINGASAVTLAGTPAEIEQAARRITERYPSAQVRPVRSDTAWHSRQLASLEGWFRREIGDVQWQTPSTPFVSTVTGRVEGRLDADYWWRNLREPVRYRDAVLTALDLGANSFLELSPHRVLSGLNAANAAECAISVSIANSLVRNEDDFRSIAVATAQLHCSGRKLDWQSAAGGIARAEGLPTYPWQLAPYWRHSEEAAELLQKSAEFPLLGKRSPGPDPIWTNEVSLGAFPFLRDHVVGGDVVFPAAGFIEIMLCAGREIFGDVPLEIEDFEILAALFVGTDEHVLFSTRLDVDRHLVHIRTRTRDGASEWTTRASAQIRPTDIRPELRLPRDELSGAPTSGDDFYAQTALAGFGYGPAFRAIASATVAAHSAAGVIAAPEQVLLEGSLAHPCLLDAALQLTIAMVPGARGDAAGQALYLPTTLRRLRFAGRLAAKMSVRSDLEQAERGAVVASYDLADLEGRCLLSIEGLEMRQAGRQAADAEVDPRKVAYYAETFVPFVAAERKAMSGNWLILSGDRSSAESLAEAIEGEGGSVATLDLSAIETSHEGQLSRARELASPAIGQANSVIFHVADGVKEDDLVSRSEQNVLQLIAVAQALQTLDPEKPVRELIIVTHGARSLPGDPPMTVSGLAASAAIGLTRTIASENPELRVRQIDCSPGAIKDVVRVLTEAGDDESEFVVRDGASYVPRLTAHDRSDLPRGFVDVDVSAGNGNFQLTMKTPGAAANLFLEACPTPGLGPDEALVETAAVGLNFRDVMAVTGLLPAGAEPDPAWLNLGLEFAGTIRAVGRHVSGLGVGDRVMGMARGALKGLVALPAQTLVQVPSDLSLRDAASIPSAFATAHYALAHAGRVRKGERVLIHLGTGGVGLAAIQVARSLGAEVIATAGSDEKRDYLRGMGVSHVFNSRSLGFADDVMVATGGKGVDVILNALPTHYIAKGLEVLAPFGRFLEIGKRDVYADTPLGMLGLRRNISFHVIDLAAMGAERPDLLANILAEVLRSFAEGTYCPMPVTYFPIDRASEAFDLMAKGRHIGKVVIGLEPVSRKVRASVSRELVARRDRSYLVTGGTSGFGVEIARWLGRHGAGHLILASRSGKLPPRHEGLPEELGSAGSTVEVVALDLTDATAVDAFVAARTSADKPIAGIVHGAAVFKDGLLSQLDEASIRAVLAPKIAGAWALHKALEKHGTEIDFFLSLSSVAQVLGSLGQANYVAANSFLDGFANYRAGCERPAQAVSLGALGEAGFVAENAAMGSYLESMGILPMASADALDSLDGFAVSSAVSRTMAAIDWTKVRSAFGSQGVTPRLAGLMPGTPKGDHKLRQMLAAVPAAAWPALLQEFLVEEVSRVLDVEPQSVPVNRPLAELGLDSLSSIELKNRIETRLALTMTVGAFLQAPTLEKLSSVIASTFEEQARTAREAGSGPQESSEMGQATQFSDRQRWAIQVAFAPMTSAPGRASLEQVVRYRPNEQITVAYLQEALSRLCRAAPQLALRCERTTLSIGAAPEILVTGALETPLALPLDLERGELLRIAVCEENGAVVEIGLRKHLAIDLDGGKILNALTGDGSSDLGQPALAVSSDRDKVAAIARTRAVLEPWAPSIELAGARPMTKFVDGLNIGRIVHYEVLRVSAELSEADCLLAFARALGTVGGRRDIMIERFVGARGVSYPVRVAFEPGATSALAVINHQLSLREPVLEACAMELLLADVLATEKVRVHQLGFSFAHGHDSAIPAWNDLAAHFISSGGETRITLAHDVDAVDAATLRQIVDELANALRQFQYTVTLTASGVASASVPVATAMQAANSGELAGYPVTAPLANLLDEISDPAATGTLRRASLLCQAIRIRPGVDAHRLQRAVDRVVDRHEFLRTRFTRYGGQWRAVASHETSPLVIHDMPGTSDAAITQSMRDIADRAYDVSQTPLVEVHLLRSGKAGDVVLVRLFEGVADGWSLGIILDELLKAYIGLDLGGQPPGVSQILALTGPTIGTLSGAAPRASQTRVNRLALGPSRVRTLRLGTSGADALRKKAASLGTTENGLIAAAFVNALRSISREERLELGTYDPTRRDPRLLRAVGFLSRLVQLDVSADGNVPQLARQLDTQFLDLSGKPSVLGSVPEYIYAPLLPRQMLDRSLFGPAVRQLSKGRVSVMSMEIEAIDIAPFGLQEGRLQLRPLATHGGDLELNFYYEVGAFADAEISELSRTTIASTGLPLSIVEDEVLSEILAAPEDLKKHWRSLETT